MLKTRASAPSRVPNTEKQMRALMPIMPSKYQQHAEMSLFVKHVADKQQFHVTIPCFSLTLRRVPTQSRSRHFGGVSEKKTRSDHVTRNASARRNNEAYGQGIPNTLSVKLSTHSIALWVFYRFNRQTRKTCSLSHSQFTVQHFLIWNLNRT